MYLKDLLWAVTCGRIVDLMCVGNRLYRRVVVRGQ